jgi:predicted flap endonuclease-1-like 5' DNA nuclease
MVEVEVYGIPVILWGKQIGILALYHDLSSLMQAAAAAAAPEAMYDEYTAAEEALVDEAAEEVEEFDAELEQDAMAKLAKKPVNEIEGIGPAYSEKLAVIEITTINEYLEATADRDGRKDVAERTGISPKLVLEWANRADLMRVHGIGEEFSDLLEQAGVDTVNELKFRNSENLYAALVEINQEKNLVRRMPSEADVEAWIESAKQLPAILTY